MYTTKLPGLEHLCQALLDVLRIVIGQAVAAEEDSVDGVLDGLTLGVQVRALGQVMGHVIQLQSLCFHGRFGGDSACLSFLGVARRRRAGDTFRDPPAREAPVL